MTPTPHKPVALAELPVVAHGTRRLKDSSKVLDSWAAATSLDYIAAHKSWHWEPLTLHAEATRLVADLRDENERLRGLLAHIEDDVRNAKLYLDVDDDDGKLGPHGLRTLGYVNAAIAKFTAALKEKSA